MPTTNDLFKKAEAHVRAGRHDAAMSVYRAILRRDPDDVRAIYRLAVVQLMKGQYAEGEALLRKSLEFRPDDPDMLFSLGRACTAQGHHPDAIAALEMADRIAPRRSDIKSALGDAHFLSGNPKAAYEVYRAAMVLDPKDMRTRTNVALTINRLGNHEEALEFLRPTYEQAGDNPAIAKFFAEILRSNGLFEEALGVIDKILVARPDDHAALCSKAAILDRAGQTQAAAEILLPLLNAGTQSLEFAQACGHVANNQREQILDPQRVADLLEASANHARSNVYERRGLLFALANLLDKVGDYSRAFDACLEANAILPLAYDKTATDARFQQYRDTFTPEKWPDLARASNRETRPLFILGMPRSGTTLVEQILDSHPDVTGSGELSDIQLATRAIKGYPESLGSISSDALDTIAESYLAHLDDISPDTRYVTDKMPINFEHLGFIWQTVPGSRIIHCQRHPLDVCLSCLFRNFQNENRFANDIDNLASYYRNYHALMEFWGETLDLPRFDLRYDDLVNDPKTTIAALLEFCELPWDDACLTPERNQRFVSTASYAQVRQPINADARARYRKYEAQLAPLAEALSTEIARYEAGD